ncbi:cell adhesion molecule 4-like [Homarus americanus]|uniref:cell adhesion molecule 4-like n=1 Tax=Homarus americanus TaxID=6706 RepID=UPI001C4835D4|nr:cell adhesion molecule 4-like [Homarus americanus]
MSSPFSHTFTILLLIVFGSSAALEIQEVQVPRYKVRGSRAELSCRYTLANATLYSLKWYKGDKLFYQYIPANNVTKNTFNVAGVNIDVGSSTGEMVVLQDLELATSGTYRCEVITEAPLFITRFGQGNMTVIDLPESAPVLDGARTSYQLGERVVVNCTSLYSKPAATLQWYINDHLVTQANLLKRYKLQKERDGLETAVLGLTFVTARSHFPRGEMRLKCVAKIATVYFQSQETSVIETGYMLHTQPEERRHNENSYFFGSGADRCSAGLFPLILVALLNT